MKYKLKEKDKERMITACMKNKGIKWMYDNYIMTEKISFENWVKNMVEHLSLKIKV